MGNCLESCSVALRIEAPNVISFKLFKACEEGNVEAVLKLLHPPKEPTEQDLKEQNITDPKEWKRPHPAKADVSDRDGAQPIHIAAQNGFGKVIEILVEHGADPQARDNTGWCPAHSACMYGHVDALKVILEKTNGFAINTRTDDGVSLLHVLAQQGNLTFTKFLCYVDLEFTNLQLLPKDIWGYYPFHYAAENKHPRLLQFLLEHLETNTDYSAKELVNYNTAGGATCIHFACANGDDETLKLLLKYGAYPDAKGTNGIEPIHLCAEKGHISTMKILLGTLSDEEKAAIDERRKADKISKKSNNNSKQVSQNNTGRASGSNSLSATPKNNTSNQESSAQTPNVEKPIVATTEEEQDGKDIVPTSNNDEEDQKQEEKEEQEKKDEELRRIEEHFHSTAQHLFPKNEEYIDRRPHHTSLTTRTRQGYTVLMYAVAAKQVEMIKFLVNEMKVSLTTKCVAETTALDFAKQRKLREVIELLGGNLEEYDKEEEDRLLRRQLREQLQREKEEQERKEKEEGGGGENNNHNSGAVVTASSSATTALHQDERQKDQENHDALPGEEQPSTMSCDSGVETVAGAVRSTHPADNDDDEEENQKNDCGNRNDNDDNDVDVPVVKNDDSNEPIAE